MESLSYTSFAKVNLYLQVVGRRPDGYHNVETILQTISLHDTLVFRAVDGPVTVQCEAEGFPLHDNSILRSARLLKNHARTKGRDLADLGADITLNKTIPMEAGLGGGSSNAATTLIALDRLWGLGLAESELHVLARKLGADVPFFLRGGTAAGWGIGDRLLQLSPIQKTCMVLLGPSVPIPTRWAYDQLHAPAAPGEEPEQVSGCSEPFQRAIQALSEGKLTDILFNVFEDIVYRAHPGVLHLKELLLNAGATRCLMSGSGSAIFGVVPSEDRAVEVLETVRKTTACDGVAVGTVETGWATV